jgi:hypothetical protein
MHTHFYVHGMYIRLAEYFSENSYAEDTSCNVPIDYRYGAANDSY